MFRLVNNSNSIIMISRGLKGLHGEARPKLQMKGE